MKFPTKIEKKKIKIISEDVEKFNISSAVDIGKEAIGLIKERNPGMKCDAGLSKVVSYKRILNSAGLDENYKQTVFSYGLTGVIVIDNSFLDLWEFSVGCKLNIQTQQFVSKILHNAELAQKVAKLPTKRMNVIFMPRAMPAVLPAIMIAVNGKQIQKKASPLINKLGDKILDEKLSITDDGTIDLFTGSSPFDDEGIASRSTPIIDKGVLKNFIFDLQTAGILNLSSTGNGHRGHNALPSPGQLTGLYLLEPGKWKI